MSLKPELIPPVPELTVQVAKASFPKGNVYMQMRDSLGGIYQDDQFMHLYGAPAQLVADTSNFNIYLSQTRALETYPGQIDESVMNFICQLLEAIQSTTTAPL
jgi:hypothetical protein